MTNYVEFRPPPRRYGSWPEALPVLANAAVTLRELTPDDAPALQRHLVAPVVGQFTTEPPTTIDAFRRHIEWAQAERAAARHASFGIVPKGMNEPVGVMQIWVLDRFSGVMEWGGVIGPQFWRVNLCTNGARLLLDFAFEVLGAHRIEARVCVENEAAHAVMRKLGGYDELLLRQSIKVRGEYRDHVLWSILRDDWQAGLE